ncbi:MAG: hypothetical protein V4455_09915, partial [Pseudomonadota bacterium]
PGSPVALTCLNDAVNEHTRQSVAKTVALPANESFLIHEIGTVTTVRRRPVPQTGISAYLANPIAGAGSGLENDNIKKNDRSI